MNSLASDMVGIWRRSAGGKPEFDPEQLRHVLRLAKQAGLTRPMPVERGRSAEGDRRARGLDRVERSAGRPPAASAPGATRGGRPGGPLLSGRRALRHRAAADAGRTGHAAWPGRSARCERYCTPADKDILRLGSLLDVRCYAIGTVPNVPAAADSTRKAGAAFWWYANAARELPDVRRYLSGVWFWSTGADGQGYWVYQSRWRRSPAFQDLQGTSHSHDYVAYPDVDGPIPTIQWECIRMGIDDARYLYTLEAAIAARRGSPQAAAAEKFSGRTPQNDAAKRNVAERDFDPLQLPLAAQRVRTLAARCRATHSGLVGHDMRGRRETANRLHVVTAKYPDRLWHTDLSVVPTSIGGLPWPKVISLDV